MIDLSRKKNKPGTFYALAFCVSVIAFVMMCAGAFTPDWSYITENDGANDVTYERGLVVTCDRPGTSGCAADAKYGSSSGQLLASFVMTIFAIILAFLTLQLFVLGQCVRSIRERNLGIPLTALALTCAILLVASLALFEISISKETTTGYTHVKATFGFSRGIIIGAVILYLCAAFFTLGEYFKRQHPMGSAVDPHNGRQSRVFSIRTNQDNKRLSHTEGQPVNTDNFRTRGTFYNDAKKSDTVVAGVSLWR